MSQQTHFRLGDSCLHYVLMLTHRHERHRKSVKHSNAAHFWVKFITNANRKIESFIAPKRIEPRRGPVSLSFSYVVGDVYVIDMELNRHKAARCWGREAIFRSISRGWPNKRRGKSFFTFKAEWSIKRAHWTIKNSNRIRHFCEISLNIWRYPLTSFQLSMEFGYEAENSCTNVGLPDLSSLITLWVHMMCRDGGQWHWNSPHYFARRPW